MKQTKSTKTGLPGYLFVVLLSSLVALTGCTERDLYDPNYGKPELPDAGTLPGFSTRSVIDLSVDYEAPSVKTLLQVYTEYPYDTRPDGSVTAKPNLMPVFAAYTDDNGAFSGPIELPASVKVVYLCTPTLGLPRCVDVDVVGGKITYRRTAAVTEASETRAQVSKPDGKTVPYTVDTSKALYSLCMWNENYGKPEGKGYVAGDKTLIAFINKVQKTLWNGKLSKPENLNNSDKLVDEKYANITIAKEMVKDGKTVPVIDAGIRLAFLNESGWNQNALGYYYYPADQRPTDVSKLKKYLIFPNASTGGSVPYDGDKHRESNAPLVAGSWVTLKYIDAAGKVSDRFPAGYTIGWFIISDGYQTNKNGKDGYLDTNKPFIYSNASFNTGGQKSCIALTDQPTSRVVVGFEDGGDKSYEDLLFFVESDPRGAIADPEKPSIGDGGEVVLPDQDYARLGTLAFEDNWPAKGDYDMNDVVVEYKQVVTFDSKNKVKKIVDTFKPVQDADAALFNNAFAYQVDAAQTGSWSTLPQGAEYEAATRSFILFTNAQAVRNQEFVVTRTFVATSQFDLIALKPYNPFVIVKYAPGNRKRVEVHLPKHNPTAYADPALIGTQADNYYIYNNGRYPFAFDLPVTGFKPITERAKIGTPGEYPTFNDWVAAGCGTAFADWYLHK